MEDTSQIESLKRSAIKAGILVRLAKHREELLRNQSWDEHIWGENDDPDLLEARIFLHDAVLNYEHRLNEVRENWKIMFDPIKKDIEREVSRSTPVRLCRATHERRCIRFRLEATTVDADPYILFFTGSRLPKLRMQITSPKRLLTKLSLANIKTLEVLPETFFPDPDFEASKQEVAGLISTAINLWQENWEGGKEL